MKQLYKYFVFSDVHGEYDDLMAALKEAGYEQSNPTHRLISIGDAFDRGPKSNRIYDFLKRNKAVCVKGNHDFFFEEFLEKGMDGEFVLFNILHNGLGATISSFAGMNGPLNTFRAGDLEDMRKLIITSNRSMLSWLQNMPLYYETEHFIFAHAGINPVLHNWKDTDKEYMTWDIEDSHKPCRNTEKIVVIGHHHAFRVRQNALAEGYACSSAENFEYRISNENHDTQIISAKCYGNKDENGIYRCENKIAIDGCVNLTHKVNVLVIEDYELPRPEENEEMSQTVYTDDPGLWSDISYTNPFKMDNVTANMYTTTFNEIRL